MMQPGCAVTDVMPIEALTALSSSMHIRKYSCLQEPRRASWLELHLKASHCVSSQLILESQACHSMG